MLKRLRNLWRLSSLDLVYDPYTAHLRLVPPAPEVRLPKRAATIIIPDDELKDFPKEA